MSDAYIMGQQELAEIQDILAFLNGLYATPKTPMYADPPPRKRLDLGMSVFPITMHDGGELVGWVEDQIGGVWQFVASSAAEREAWHAGEMRPDWFQWQRAVRDGEA